MGAVRRAFSGPAPVPLNESGAGAAVLITLVPCDESGDASRAAVVLIRRAAQLRRNPGEIAFPGGRIEPGEDPLAAALREAEEETALRADRLDVLGPLATLGRSRRSDLIVPFVAATRARQVLVANPEEVEAVIVVPLEDLVAEGRYWQELWDEDAGPTWTMHFFDLGDDVIWGATARMLYSFFLRVLRGNETSQLL